MLPRGKVRIVKSSSSPEKPDRKTVERNRRIKMKALCSELTSLIPSQHFNPSKELLSQQDQLDQAAAYINQLKERIDELKVKKEVALISIDGGNRTSTSGTSNINYNYNYNMKYPMSGREISLRVPVVELRELDSSNIEVVLISGLPKNFILYQVIAVLHEEGTDVVSATVSNVGDRAFHTLHAQVKVSRVGVDTSMISQRLKELLHSTSSFM